MDWIKSTPEFWAIIVAAYLLGSVPFGIFVARARGVDIRKVGSGNIGATNVFRVVGKKWGLLTFFLDFLKGLAPTLTARLLFGDTAPVWVPLVCGCAAILGHNFSVFLKFTGGKGIATSGGVLLGAAPLAVLIGLLSWAALTFGTGYVSVGSVGAAFVLAIAAWPIYLSRGWALPAVLTLLGLLAIWKHRANIVRLCRGEEHRFNFRNKTTPTKPNSE